MDETDLAHYLRSHNIKAELISLKKKTPTVNDAAAAVGVPVEQIGKSILFMSGETPVLVIANGNARISYKKLAQEIGINRRKINIANADQVLDLTGFPVGTVPPFGHLNPIKTYIDSGIFDQPILYTGGGSIKTLLRIEPAEIMRVSKAAAAFLQEG